MGIVLQFRYNFKLCLPRTHLLMTLPPRTISLPISVSPSIYLPNSCFSHSYLISYFCPSVRFLEMIGECQQSSFESHLEIRRKMIKKNKKI